MFPGIGSILITKQVEVLRNINLGPMTRIINLDEDGMLPEAPDIIGGTILLPPIEAKIAEADGDEQLFDNIYVNYLQSPAVKQYIAALMSYVYRGGNLILFLPDLEYTNTFNKLLLFVYQLYGVHIGIVEDPNNAACYYIPNYAPLWLEMIYATRVVMGPHEFLYMYPDNIIVNNMNPAIIGFLLEDIRPMGDTIEEKLGELEKLHKLLKQNPNVREALIKC